jgi:predicted transcriptional regulator
LARDPRTINYIKEQSMATQNAIIKNAAASAAQKVATGALLTISETAAMLSVAPATVHALPLPSIRLGKSLRFDPADVRRLIEQCKEAVIPVSEVAVSPAAAARLTSSKGAV